MSINSVILEGRLTADPELRKAGEVSVTNFSLAVNRPKNKDGESVADFFNIQAWRGSAELICKHLKKGDRVAIEGSLRTNKFTDKEGQNRVSTYVHVDNVHFLSVKKKDAVNEAPAENVPDFTDINADDDDLPF